MLTKHRQISDNKYNFYLLLSKKLRLYRHINNFKWHRFVLTNFLLHLKKLPPIFFKYPNDLPKDSFQIADIIYGYDTDEYKYYYIEGFNKTIVIKIRFGISVSFSNMGYYDYNYETISIETVINWIKENAHKT